MLNFEKICCDYFILFSAGREYVSAIDFNIDDAYVTGTYESCKSVVHPASGRVAMDFSCGNFDSRSCSAHR